MFVENDKPIGQFSSEAKRLKTSQRDGFYDFHIEPKESFNKLRYVTIRFLSLQFPVGLLKWVWDILHYVVWRIIKAFLLYTIVYFADFYIST